jgi:phospholipid/cholesterol/gamma-HCH transport system ATP-binding protein
MAREEAPVLEFKNVSLRFGKISALKNVSFQLYPGDSRIIFGAAGSGKTMLLKAVVGLVPIDDGEICLFGETVNRMSEQDLFGLRSRAGFLFQEGGLFDSLKIGENVEYPLVNRQAGHGKNKPVDVPSPEEAEQRVRAALRFVELEHTLNQFPSEVSGGMRRRVGIARAIVTEPPLVLYDSPTAGLDPITANTIMGLIAKERDTRNSASLIVTHRYQDGEIMANFVYSKEREELEPMDGNTDKCTRFFVMKGGEIVFTGTRQELESSSDDYVKKFIRRES